ncbi:MAG: class I SAM-dependent methyltransferase [Bacteroidia bacterium]|nr:class I SAM-dependent methyltransferase [Bacteroidia bacterium]
MHSPFVFEWYQQVLRANLSEETAAIEQLRKELIKDQREMQIQDFGAGSGDKGPDTKARALGDLVRKASRRRKSGDFLFRLCQFYQPSRCLEFGTHIGISSLYQMHALEGGEFYTMEGDPGLAEIAKTNFERFGKKANQYIGEFDRLLKTEISLSELKPDYVFIDGNHTHDATLRYFHLLLPHMPDESMIIFDDIYWSEGMKKAWKEIIAHPEVSVSLDLFEFGLCFIRRKQAKEHFRFRL